MPALPKHILSHPKLIHRYRPNVAAIIQRNNGDLLWCERNRHPYHWQFPQGGVDDGETLEEALFREIKEELGIEEPNRVLQIRKKREKTSRYIFPAHIISKYLDAGRSSYIGQEQHWFLLDFTGTDADININFEGENCEFRSFCWGGAALLPRVSFLKRKTYRILFEEFDIASKNT